MITHAGHHSGTSIGRLSTPSLRSPRIPPAATIPYLRLQSFRNFYREYNQKSVTRTTGHPATQHRAFADMAAPKLQNLKVFASNGIATLLYANPKANALSAQLMQDLIDGISWAENNKEVKVILLSGEGKFFTAGLDLTNVPKEGPVLPDSSIELLRSVDKGL